MKWYWAIAIAVLILGGIFSSGCTALKISREDATAIVKEASSAAAGAAVDSAVSRFGETIDKHLPLDAIESAVKAAMPEPGTDPAGPASAAGLAALYIINQIRKQRRYKKDKAAASG